MKPPSESPNLTPAEAARARRQAEKATALRANLARRKAQARAQTAPEPAEKEQKCR
jgi:hypothetical protein